MEGDYIATALYNASAPLLVGFDVDCPATTRLGACASAVFWRLQGEGQAPTCWRTFPNGTGAEMIVPGDC